MNIKELRSEFGWSQSQLATASGLSLRTIQRIENGHPASVESLKAISSALEIENFNDLKAPKVLSPEEIERIEKERGRINEQREFYKHLSIFAVVLSIVALKTLLSESGGSIYMGGAMFGWAIWLAIEGSTKFEARDFWGREWEEKKLMKRLEDEER